MQQSSAPYAGQMNDTLRINIISAGFPASTTHRAFTEGFKIVRKPRALVGEDAVQLPTRMVIDLQPFAAAGFSNPSPTPWCGVSVEYDILFLPSGEISGAPDGKITLLLRHEDENNYPNDVGKMTLVVIYTRTGQIIMHPVSNGGDPYEFTKDGQGSGL